MRMRLSFGRVIAHAEEKGAGAKTSSAVYYKRKEKKGLGPRLANLLYEVDGHKFNVCSSFLCWSSSW